MPNYTEKYNLKKPLQDEFYNIDDHNGNMDIIDAELKRLAESSGVVISPDEPETGDVWIDTDDEEGGESGGVTSVNGKTGDVQLEAKDVDAYATGQVYTKEEIIGLLNGKANGSHGHDVVDISGILPVANGGTGVSSLEALKTALGGGGAQVLGYVGSGGTHTLESGALTLSFDIAPKFVIMLSNLYVASFISSGTPSNTEKNRIEQFDIFYMPEENKQYQYWAGSNTYAHCCKRVGNTLKLWGSQIKTTYDTSKTNYVAIAVS